MRINLQEIPEEGKSFICNRHTAELNEILKDLVGNIPHLAEFTIKPLSSGSFELTGFIQTEVPELCSRCGIDMKVKVNERFREMMMPELDQPRNTKYSKANHFSEMVNEELSIVEYRGHHFEMGEYLHEIVGLALPFNPAPAANEKGDCGLCLKPIQNQPFVYNEEEKEAEVVKESPFAALKGLKLN